MAKKINITDKLNFESNPIIVIGDLEVEVKSDAETMLRMMEYSQRILNCRRLEKHWSLSFPQKM